jgi:hypothetical protein
MPFKALSQSHFHLRSTLLESLRDCSAAWLSFLCSAFRRHLCSSLQCFRPRPSLGTKHIKYGVNPQTCHLPCLSANPFPKLRTYMCWQLPKSLQRPGAPDGSSTYRLSRGESHVCRTQQFDESDASHTRHGPDVKSHGHHLGPLPESQQVKSRCCKKDCRSVISLFPADLQNNCHTCSTVEVMQLGHNGPCPSHALASLASSINALLAICRICWATCLM